MMMASGSIKAVYRIYVKSDVAACAFSPSSSDCGHQCSCALSLVTFCGEAWRPLGGMASFWTVRVVPDACF